MEDPITELQQIFPTWNRQKLHSIFVESGSSLDRTIEAIFAEEAKESGGNNSNTMGAEIEG